MSESYKSDRDRGSIFADLTPTFFYSVAGGFADALGFLMTGSFTGHITGNLVLLFTSAASGHDNAMFRPLAAIVSFLGATVLGIVVRKSGLRGAQWFVLLSQTLLICTLGFSMIRLSVWFPWALVIAFAVSLGLQNGYTSIADGVVVHVSYMTGTATRLAKAFLELSVASEGLRDPQVFATILMSSAVLLGFTTGAVAAVVASRVFMDYAPLFLCVPLLLATVTTYKLPLGDTA